MEMPSKVATIHKDRRIVYIHRAREVPPSEPFTSTDGLDLYIDGARFLPDAVTVSRVTGRIFDRNYNKIGPDISTGIDLNSSVFDPIYNYSVEIRNLRIPPTAMLLLKVYSIDRFSLNLVLIGWAALNLFVESGTENAPTADSAGVQVSLNEGPHQIRLYHSSPPTDRPLSVHALADGGRVVPCATLLVRLVKAPVDKNLQTLQKIAVPQEDWARLGLFQARPDYSDGVYYSNTARPTQGENCLYSAMANRSVVPVRDVVIHLSGNRAEELKTDEDLSAWIKKKMSLMMDSNPQPFELSCVSRYLTAYGVKVSLDSAKNLPWSGFTFAHFCLNPPGAFYFGAPWLKYDRVTFVENMDFSSYQQCPTWGDGFKPFPRRLYKEHLTVIFHLYEVSINTDSKTTVQMKPSIIKKKENRQPLEQSLVFAAGSQAWTALHVFRKGYCNTGTYQLPLYKGAPNQAALAALTSGECEVVLKDLLRKKTIKFVPGASLFVRIADGRRDEELGTHILTSYLPVDTIDAYNREPSGNKISDLFPQGTSGEDIKRDITRWFRKTLCVDRPSKPRHIYADFLVNHLTHPSEQKLANPANAFQEVFKVPTNPGSRQMDEGRSNEMEGSSLSLTNQSQVSLRDISQVGGYDPAPPIHPGEANPIAQNVGVTRIATTK